MDMLDIQPTKKNPNSKIITSLVVVVAIFMTVVGGGYYCWARQRQMLPLTGPAPFQTNPILSDGNKTIMQDNTVLLSIDNDEIFNFFKTQSQLCNKQNLESTATRKMFCTDIATFKSETRFSSIVLSPDKTKIGFAIETDEMSPDKTVGIFYVARATDTIHFLTNFYLGNEFISFSPAGVNFVVKGGCWEGMCGLVIKNSETLEDKISLNNPAFVDMRTENTEFIKWISDNEVEYKIGNEVKQVKF